MHAGGPLSRKGFPGINHEHRYCERGSRDARDATTRPSSLGSDGSSMAISADQTEGKRMQRRAKAAMRNAMSMTNIARDGRGRWWWTRERRTKRGRMNCPTQSHAIDFYVITPIVATLCLLIALLLPHAIATVTAPVLQAIRGHRRSTHLVSRADGARVNPLRISCQDRSQTSVSKAHSNFKFASLTP